MRIAIWWIDPVLIYSTYLGEIGPGRRKQDSGDADGKYLCRGRELLGGFPGRKRAADFDGVGDAFLKYDPSGKLIYATYPRRKRRRRGVRRDDGQHGERVFPAGSTYSLGFPPRTAQRSRSGGVRRFVDWNQDRRARHCSYLGGSGGRRRDGLTDGGGNAYHGTNAFVGFPARGAYQAAMQAPGCLLPS